MNNSLNIIRPECDVCGSPIRVTCEDYSYTESGLANVTLKKLKLRSCPKCGTKTPVLPHPFLLNHRLTVVVLQDPARLTPDRIRFLRKRLGYSIEKLAKEMGVAAVSASRWESDRPMDPLADRLLRAMVILGNERSFASMALSDERPRKIKLESNGDW